MTLTEHPLRPPGWDILVRAIEGHHRIRLRYHGHDRIVCPHALGWKRGRIVALVYQCGGTTSGGVLPTDPRQRWRSLLLDDIEQAGLIDGAWQSADNYSVETIPIDTVMLAADPK